MASSSNWLSGVNVVLVMAYGSLVRRTPFHSCCGVCPSRDPRELFLGSIPQPLALYLGFCLVYLRLPASD